MGANVTEQLSEGLHAALRAAGLAPPEELLWEVPRESVHGDYATNVAMQLAKAARRPPRQVAELIVKHWPSLPAVERVEVAGPGFVNVFLAGAWCADALRQILAAGAEYGQSPRGRGQRVRIEFVSANPTGPLVIVNARAAAIGDALARILRSQGYTVFAEYYVNDAGNQATMLARSMEARVRQLLGEARDVPEGGYPGEYLVDVAKGYLAEEGAHSLSEPEAARLERLGRYAVRRIREAQERVLREYGVEFDRWVSENVEIRKPGLPEEAIELLRARDLVYEAEGALWFRASRFGDDEDRVLVKSDGELTYFAADIAYHLFKFGDADRLIDLIGPDHHGYVARIKAAMIALGKPADAVQVLIVQLVTLLRGGEPVRMSKRRGEFVLMEELIEEVGRDAARFTFLTRRHDSPLDFDIEVVTRQSADNPVYYVQYCHARISSIFQHLKQRKLPVPDWRSVDLSRLTLPEELALIKRLLQFPDLVAGAARTLEPHRVAYYLQELAAGFHPYYNRHRVVSEDRALTDARLALAAAVGQVVRNGLALLGVSAPEKM
ncbi:MAG: arginine--tRNA ligase [Candidatus Rokubacteria bacterium]|nr:arginine--tRNA ligase [Candidatus Rokubacteria bacterium]